MWKITILTILLTMSLSVHGAVMYCDPSNTISCVFANITNVAAPNEDITVYGKPITFIEDYYNSMFITESSQIDYFPTKIFKIYINLFSLSMQSCNLRYLVTDTFNYCDRLDTIFITNTTFTHLPAGFAQNCVHLRVLIMQQGQLVTLDVNALAGLGGLALIDLNSNKIVCIPPSFLSPSPLIESFTMNGNRLAAIDIDIIKGLKFLQSVGFNGNRLEAVPNLSFVDTSVSQTFNRFYIHFDDNPIMAIHPDFISNMYTTLPANISYVQIVFSIPLDYSGSNYCISSQLTSFDKESWSQYATLILGNCYTNWPSYSSHSVSCPIPETTTSTTTTTTSTTRTTSVATTTKPVSSSGCSTDRICRYYVDYLGRYTCVLDGVDGTVSSIVGSHISPLLTDANVTRVYFSNSFLSRVPPILFTKFPNIDFLSVANCSLGMITDATIASCGNLVYLDARFNEISYVSSAAFKNCSSLQTIDFSGNPIDKLDTSIFVQDPSLKKIILNSSN